MEVNLSPNPNAFYTCAPTSPKRYNLNGFFFLSMPTSPTRNPPGDPSGFKSGSITPKEAHNLSPFADNFEFEGSKRFYPYDNGSEKSQELAMAYADELFYDGKMLPLRPAPRAQARFQRTDKRPSNGSTASSPGGRSSMLLVPFLRQRNLWNDEFDPFMAALNMVKGEDNVVMGSKGNQAQLRRAKSLSPLRGTNGSTRWTAIHQQHQRLGLSPDARMEINGPQKAGLSPMIPDAFGPVMRPEEGAGIGKAGSLESRKQRIKKFLLKNATFGREVSGEKRVQRAPLLLRKLQSSGRFRLGTKPNSIMRISREMKALMKHRARVFFCLVKGLGIQSTRKLS